MTTSSSPCSSSATSSYHPRPFQNDNQSQSEAAIINPISRRPISMAMPFTALTIGFFGGLYTSAQRASLVFLAENAHRRPDTVQGWYFYNKTKNYKVLLAGITGGAKSGLSLAIFAGSYLLLERGISTAREWALARSGHAPSHSLPQDPSETEIREQPNGWRALDGGLAGVGISTAASAMYRIKSPLSTRLILLGLLSGSAIGGLNDAKAALAVAKEKALARETSQSAQ